LYFLTKILAYAFFLAGGLYLIKFYFKKKQVLVILNYHNFSKYNNYKIKRGDILETGYNKSFEKQIRFIKRHFNFCYPEEFFIGNCEYGINVLITFDDGYKDNFDIAMPILYRNNASAIFFLTTSFIGTDNWLWHDKVRYLTSTGQFDQKKAEGLLLRMNSGINPDRCVIDCVSSLFPVKSPKRIMLNWDEVTEIWKSGFSLGSHTVSHSILDQLDYNTQLSEIVPSVESISLKTGIKCKYIAYPNGHFNDTTLKIARDHKIEFGFSVEPGINERGTDKLFLRRIGVSASNNKYILVFKIFISMIR
jgi:peptidoglycan/xylan/chitin deacetylase (PgdA/CDA1 family)